MSVYFLLALGLVSIGSTLPWQGPQQTKSATSTASWTPAPTSIVDEDIPFLELIRRDVYPVSLCGWIGGDVAEGAYCSTQSSCVWNSDYSIVGCCATASSNCAFYTTCIDMNSPQQTGDSDDVFTCRGTSLCYENTYPGDYKQWGCGSTDWATNIATSFSGIADDLSLQIVTTGTGAQGSAAETNTINEGEGRPSSSITTTDVLSQVSSQAPSSASENASSNSVESSPTSVGSSAFTTASGVSSKSINSTAAVAGGVIGGIAAVGLLGALFFFRRRRRNNSRVIPAHSAHPSTHALVQPPYAPMAQVPSHHTPAHAAPSHPASVGASSAEPKYDKKGVLIPEKTIKNGPSPAAAKKVSGAVAKKSAKSKTGPPASGSATKGTAKPKNAAASTKAKKSPRPKAGSAGGPSTK